MPAVAINEQSALRKRGGDRSVATAALEVTGTTSPNPPRSETTRSTLQAQRSLQRASMSAVAARSEHANAYQRRRPKDTALDEIVRDNHETLYGAIDDSALEVCATRCCRAAFRRAASSSVT